ncbi:pitrilysin family protein [Erythrobacter sp. HL-111]|uniref:M16 family metallopeptidase n=1 Tax=Erythrobacter sp. HL-111 TaxID=1798193 RepID=UPI0006DA83B8|nr:insulinase family protein [Erythrobacter sp. HL-111]KPP88481.1 MAG: zinc protease [Erythrobacteraceae bacterium HL-111]SDS19851.1 zinc protease [Erythrobacter sp. HL-111]
MNLPVRAAAALSLLVAPLALFAPVSAQEAEAPAQVDAPAEPAIPAPTALQKGEETPWLYEGSNVPVDREWLFGEMENGLRYAVRRNGVPPGQVSIRVRIDAGSLHEDDDEQGFAHLLEHLLFRESKYLGKAEAIAAWQRLGATFGADANAETSPTHTAYKLDIPNIDRAKLNESFKLLSGMIREPVLDDTNVAAERPIVLAEKRERGGAGQRVADLTRQTLFAGQRLATRNPIGTVETLRAADGASVKAFYDRWYRPENTVIVVAGDADPQILAGLIEQWFGDWQGTGEPGVAPEFGDPLPPAGAPENPVAVAPIGQLGVATEPDLPRNLTYAVMRPWRKVDDTIVYNEGLLLDAVAQAIINRRLESRARAGGSYLYASVRQEDISRSADATFVSFAPLTGDWQAALADVRAVIADALANPPTQEEIDREVAEFDVVFANQVEQRSVQAGSELADNLVNAVDIRETVAAPEVVLDVFRGMKDRLNPAEVLERTRALFEGTVTRSVYVTPAEGEADENALKLALSREVAADPSARLAAASIDFSDLPPVGEPGTIVSREPLGILEVEQIAFDNGVKALVWANDAESGRATVRVRFGAGYRAFDESSAVYAPLGEVALVGSGLGELGQEQLDRLATGRKLGFEFGIDDAVFNFTAQTRPEDVADQLYLFAAKLGMPRWDLAPVKRAKAAAELAYNTFATSPGGIIARDLEYIQTDMDPRFATPDPQALEGVTPERFREVWEPLLAQGPVEVLVFGQFDKEAIVEKLRTTFGALPDRQPIPEEVAARVPDFPPAGEAPVVRYHRGDPDQAAAAVTWPSAGGMARIREARQLEILIQVFNNRLMDALREETGASYSPQVFSKWPEDLPEGGRITALAQLEPEFVPFFFAAADKIATDLATEAPTADELERVTAPLAERIRRASTGNQFWLYNLEGATTDPARVNLLRSLLADYSQTTPEIMLLLADRYFARNEPLKLAVIPEGQELADTPPPSAVPDVAPEPSSAEPAPAEITGR